MLQIVGLVVGVLILTFIVFVSTRPNKFRYERSGVIKASSEKIFPYISEFKKGSLWSPYEKMDPNMKKVYGGTDGQPGSFMQWDGNQDAGAGSIELLSLVPNREVHFRLTMKKPLKAVNLVQYSLTPENEGTRFTWVMSGEVDFVGKLVNVFVDCEKLVADQFVAGIENLKNLIEGQQ